MCLSGALTETGSAPYDAPCGIPDRTGLTGTSAHTGKHPGDILPAAGPAGGEPRAERQAARARPRVPVGRRRHHRLRARTRSGRHGRRLRPYAVLTIPGGRLVADAAGSDVLFVDMRGHIRVFHVFPSVTTGACAGQGRPVAAVPGVQLRPDVAGHRPHGQHVRRRVVIADPR
jgi:hypothetical protein